MLRAHTELLLLTLAATLPAAAQPEAASGTISNFVPVTDAMLRSPDAGDWLMWRRTLDGWAYSPLDEIDKRNVGRLRQVWSHGTAPATRSRRPSSTAA